jgi:DNA-binding NtrC family response regulator
MAHDTILIVDDESDLLQGLRRTLAPQLQSRILVATSAAEALELLASEQVDLVLTDIRMPEMDGMRLLERIRSTDPAVTVIIMTAYGTIEKAVDAIKFGAYDFIQKPLDEQRLVHLLRKGLERNRLVREVERLKASVCRMETLGDMVGRSVTMQKIFARIRKLAGSEVTVLIRGETGTGKELAARAIHRLSPRADGPFVTVNCPALQETILESELFGYRKGAFTGADQHHPGLFDQAGGGTIFLDEIGDLSPSVQTKLLRVLQNKKIRPVGAAKDHPVDVRILAATNRDLETKMAENRFRRDLYYRLNVASVQMAPLRSIREDIPVLLDHFLDKAAHQSDQARKSVSTGVVNRLLAYPWPGNIRQLENVVQNWYALTPETEIEERHLETENVSPDPESAQDIDLSLSYQQLKDQVLTSFTRAYLEKLLTRHRGNISLAARQSGIKRQSLQKIIRRHGVDPDRFRGQN